jgi:hypothetical protein
MGFAIGPPVGKVSNNEIISGDASLNVWWIVTLYWFGAIIVHSIWNRVFNTFRISHLVID